MRSVRFVRRIVPVTPTTRARRCCREIDGRRAITPLALVVLAVFATDIVFAVDSVPAVYGITGDPFLVFATNAFALLGPAGALLRARGALSKLVHLGYGLAAILAFIGVKLGLHWGHRQRDSVPEIPTCGRWSSSSASCVVVTYQPAGHPGPGGRRGRRRRRGAVRRLTGRPMPLPLSSRRRCGARRTG